jgi:hypothetical protein
MPVRNNGDGFCLRYYERCKKVRPLSGASVPRTATTRAIAEAVLQGLEVPSHVYMMYGVQDDFEGERKARRSMSQCRDSCAIPRCDNACPDNADWTGGKKWDARQR